METEATAKPFNLRARLSRILYVSLGVLAVLSAICWFFWNWQGGASCALGGIGILLAGWVTVAAVSGVANADSKTMRRKIAIRLVIRFLLFIAYFTLLFTADWLIFEPLVIGMSLLFPALIIDSAIEAFARAT